MSETWSVSELCEQIRVALGMAFPRLWVAGEAQRVRASARGHLFFELVEKGRGDQVVGKLDAVVWSTDHQRIRARLARDGQRIEEGQLLRCLVGVDFYGPYGRLQLVVREVDPLYVLGELERRRRETLAALAASGLLAANAALELPRLPLAVGLVSSEGSAAYHDFLSGLSESGYGFRVLFVHAAMQGRAAEAEVASALRLLGDAGVGCVALVRGGGSRTDLAAFDSRRIAEAVARSPVPVLTGLGHETDLAIADRVAHTALKTPTKVAEHLVQRVAACEAELDGLRRGVLGAGRDRLRTAGQEITRMEREVHLAHYRLRAASGRLDELVRAAGAAAGRRVAAAAGRVVLLEERLRSLAPGRAARARILVEARAAALVGRARSRLREATLELAGLARLCSQLAPEVTLARGFSITRTGRGVVVRDPRQVRAGDRLVHELAGGALASRVEES